MDFFDDKQREIWEVLAALGPCQPQSVSKMDDPMKLLFGDDCDGVGVNGDDACLGDADDLGDDMEIDIPQMKLSSENTEFVLFIEEIPIIGVDVLILMKKYLDRVVKKKNWVVSKRKSKKKAATGAVEIVGGQLYINVQDKPSVRVFPPKTSGITKFTVQGPTHEGNVARAEEIARVLQRKWPSSHVEFRSVLTSMYRGVFIGKDLNPIKGLKLEDFNAILRDELKAVLNLRENLSFFNPEKDNCVTVYLKDATDGAKHGNKDLQGQLRLFSSGKVTGFGIKSFKTLDHFWKIVTSILWKNIDSVVTEFATKKTGGAKRKSPKCTQCGNIGHNKRTCTQK